MALALPEAVAWPEDVEVVVMVLLRIETRRRPAPGAKKTQKTFHGRAALRSCHACQAGAWHSSLELCTLGVGLDGNSGYCSGSQAVGQRSRGGTWSGTGHAPSHTRRTHWETDCTEETD